MLRFAKSLCRRTARQSWRQPRTQTVRVDPRGMGATVQAMIYLKRKL